MKINIKNSVWNFLHKWTLEWIQNTELLKISVKFTGGKNLDDHLFMRQSPCYIYLDNHFISHIMNKWGLAYSLKF